MTGRTQSEGPQDPVLRRREALKKLGLAAGVAYFAPQVTRLGTASAQGLPSPGCPPGRPGCGPSLPGQG